MIGIYANFKCSSCGKEHGKIFKWSDDGIHFGECQECGGALVRCYDEKSSKNHIPVRTDSKELKEKAERAARVKEWNSVNMPRIKAERGIIER